jgi:hypothetical protein
VLEEQRAEAHWVRPETELPPEEEEPEAAAAPPEAEAEVACRGRRERTRPGRERRVSEPMADSQGLKECEWHDHSRGERCVGARCGACSQQVVKGRSGDTHSASSPGLSLHHVRAQVR